MRCRKTVEMTLRLRSLWRPRQPVFWLTVCIAASWLVRGIEGLLEGSPVLYPDEYIYTALSRSISSHGVPSIRGGAAHFPALLEPAVTSPFWWLPNVSWAYHSILVFNALAMSLAAVPIYLLARRLGVGERLGVVIAGVSLLTPDLVYTTGVLAEPFAFPLVLAALYFAIESISTPTLRSNALFIAFSALAILCRLQFVALPATYVVALILFGTRTGTLVSTLKRAVLPLAVCLLPPAAIIALGSSRFLGYYKGATALKASPIDYLASTGRELLVLGYISGWVVIPGFLLALVLIFARPRSRYELAFASVISVFSCAVLAEAAIYGADGRVEERYFFYLVPLIFVGFVVYAKRGWPWKPAYGLISLGLLGAAFAAPTLSFVSTHDNDGSPFLLGATWFMHRYLVAGSSLLVLVLCLVSLILVLVLMLRKERALETALLLSGTLITAFAVLAGVFYYTNSTAVRTGHHWIDAAGYPAVVDLSNTSTRRLDLDVQMFWNRSLNRVATLPGTSPPDAFHVSKFTVGDDGTVLVDGKPASQVALLVDRYQTYAKFANTHKVATRDLWYLYAPTQRPRLTAYVTGFFGLGYLGVNGAAVLWPQQPGYFEMKVWSDTNAAIATHLIWFRGKRTFAKVTVRPREHTEIKLPVCRTGRAWQVNFRSTGGSFNGATLIVDNNLLSVHAGPPRFVPDPHACG